MNQKVLTRGRVYKEHLLVPQTLTRSLLDAAGLLKKKYPALKRHHEKIRKEWRFS